MQCGIDPNGSFVPSCSFMCHRSLFSSFLQVFMTIPIHTYQVCLKVNCKLSWILMQVALHLPPLFPPVSVVYVDGFSICNSLIKDPTAQVWHFYASVPRFVLVVLLFILAVTPALKESVEMYKVTKQWHSNRYLQQLMRDGIFYFLMYVSLSFPIIVTTCCRLLTLEYQNEN